MFSSNAATVTIQVTSVNEPPVAVADLASTARNNAVTIAVPANDRDVDGDIPSIIGVTSPAKGAATVSGNTIVYDPTKGFIGTEQFNYTISDGHGGSSAATVTVSVIKK